MTDGNSGQIDTVMHEDRLFPPSEEFAGRASIGSLEAYQELYDRAAADPVKFWGDLAKDELHWFEPFGETLDWQEPFAKWFLGGKTNASYNCLDRHLTTWRRNKAAIIWEGEPGDQRTLTYQQLHHEVCKFANVLKGMGVEPGDVVSIYMPMTPELAIAMLACARIGAVHSVIFAGFSAEAIADRNNDAQAKIQLTSDGAWRRGKVLDLKSTVDAALEKSPSVEKCVVLRRVGNDPPMEEARDFGGTTSWTPLRPIAPPLRSTVKLHCSSCIQVVRPENRKASNIQRQVTTCTPRRHSSGSSIIVMTTFTGAPLTAVGLRGTATSFTVPCRPGRPRSCTREHRTGQPKIVSGV